MEQLEHGQRAACPLHFDDGRREIERIGDDVRNLARDAVALGKRPQQHPCNCRDSRRAVEGDQVEPR